LPWMIFPTSVMNLPVMDYWNEPHSL